MDGVGQLEGEKEIDAMVQDQMGFHKEEVARYMHRSRRPLGHGVPASVVCHHTLPGWAIEFMLSVLQRLRTRLPDQPSPTRDTVKFANKFVRHVLQLVQEAGGMDIVGETLDLIILEATLIGWLCRKVSQNDWRNFNMTEGEVRGAVHEVVSHLNVGA